MTFDLNQPSLENFQLLKVIGQGQFAKVLQVIEKDSLKKQLEYILNERSILIKINHPFIVKMFYSFQNDKKLFFALEYCPGGELFNLLLKKKYLKEDQALFYTAQVISAINYLHQNDIIYREYRLYIKSLKPENVIIDQNGYLKLTDFGLSKFIQKDQNKSFRFFLIIISGTPEYLAPEILKNQGNHDKRVDYWTIGCFLYELVDGNPPFQSENMNELFNMIQYSQVKYNSKFSPALQILLNGLLQKDPNQRFTYRDVISSEWFKLDINKLEQKQYKAHFIPTLKNSLDCQNFDQEFLKIPLESYDENSQNNFIFNFENFDYTLNMNQ